MVMVPHRKKDNRVAVRSGGDRKSTRLNSSHTVISYAVFCLKKKKKRNKTGRRKQKTPQKRQDKRKQKRKKVREANTEKQKHYRTRANQATKNHTKREASSAHDFLSVSVRLACTLVCASVSCLFVQLLLSGSVDLNRVCVCLGFVPFLLFFGPLISFLFFFFFFNDTATTEIYTLSLHDALPIFPNPDEAVPSFVSGAMAKAGKGLLEGTLQAGTSAVSDKLLDLVGLGGKSAADKGKDTRDYLAAAFPELNAWE